MPQVVTQTPGPFVVTQGRPPTPFRMVECEVVLFPSDKDAEGKDRPPTYPSLKGKAMIQGVEYQISLWTEHTKKDPSRIYYKGALLPPFSPPPQDRPAPQ